MQAVLTKEVILNKTACRIIAVLFFVIIISLSAFVRIPLPFTPVPLTLQTFFVLLCGALLGLRLGLTAQLSYVFLGILGLPVFSGAGYGLFYLLGPTGGYIFGFLLAVLFIALFIRPIPNHWFYTFMLFCLGDMIILSCGTLWLGIILGYPLRKLLLIGFLPFIPGDLLKALAATAIYIKLQPRLKEIF